MGALCADLTRAADGDVNRSEPGLVGACLLVVAVWATLLTAQLLLAPRLGPDLAVAASFALATALVVACEAPRWGRPRGLASLASGAAIGLAAFPLFVAAIAHAGRALGLTEPAPPRATTPPAQAFAVLVLAPVFEEILYRGRLLAALRSRVGAPAAVVASGAAFAVPHVDAWSMLGAFLVGVVLGTAACVSGSLRLCIGTHVGLNLGALLARASA